MKTWIAAMLLVLSADAQEIDLSEDTAEPVAAEKAPALVPLSVRFDKEKSIVVFTWPTGDMGTRESFPLQEVVRFERARAYEELPDQLLILLSDGRRVLVSQGTEVKMNALVVPAMSGLPVKELPAGQGHLDAGHPEDSPKVVVGQGSNAMAIEPIASGGSISAPTAQSSATTTGEDGLPGEGGGVLEKQDIDSEIKSRMNLYRSCYQRELQRNPGLNGTVTVRFVIDRDGSVKLANIRSTTMNNSAVESCLASQIMSTKFPAPKGNGSVVISYPFRFSSD